MNILSMQSKEQPKTTQNCIANSVLHKNIKKYDLQEAIGLLKHSDITSF